jgi:KRAB domain-containing zinc finger protein
VVLEKNHLTRSSKPNKEDHEEIKHRKKEKQFFCDKCGNRYMFRESLRKHLLRHVNPTNSGKTGRVAREKTVCFDCGLLVDPSIMKRHIQVHHSDYRPFKCEEPGCKTTFFDVTKFNDHKNIHLGIRPYVCEFCGETFHYASNW